MIGNDSTGPKLMMNVRLDIYVERGCLGWRRANELADWARVRFPDVNVCVMAPGDDSSGQGSFVAATPAYFLNGRRFSLGNPSQDELEQAIRWERGESATLS